MEKKYGHFKDTSELPFAHYIFKDKSPDEYLVLQWGNNTALGFLWNGTHNIEPRLDEYPDLVILIASISECVCIISLDNGILIEKMLLQEDFERSIVTPYGILLMTETTIAKIERDTFAISLIVSLPDVINKYHINNNEIVITGITGEIFNVKF